MVEPSSSLNSTEVLFGSSMAEQREVRTRSPSSLDNIWRKRRMVGAQRKKKVLKQPAETRLKKTRSYSS